MQPTRVGGPNAGAFKGRCRTLAVSTLRHRDCCVALPAGAPRGATRPNTLCPSMSPQRVANGLISVKERATINRLNMADLEADQKTSPAAGNRSIDCHSNPRWPRLHVIRKWVRWSANMSLRWMRGTEDVVPMSTSGAVVFMDRDYSGNANDDTAPSSTFHLAGCRWRSILSFFRRLLLASGLRSEPEFQ